MTETDEFEDVMTPQDEEWPLSPIVHLIADGEILCCAEWERSYYSSSIDNVTCDRCIHIYRGDKGNVQFRFPNDGAATETKAMPSVRMTPKEYSEMLFRRTHHEQQGRAETW